LDLNKFKNFIIGALLSIAAVFGINQTVKPSLESLPSVSSQSTTQNATSLLGYPKIVYGKIVSDTSEVDMLKQAVLNANAVLASDCFKNFVLQAQFTETNHMNNKEIYAFMSSKIIKVNLEMFTGNFKQNYIWRTVGYDIGDGTVYMNRHFVDSSSIAASNIIHESMHAIGFHHDQIKETSVPYMSNDAYDLCSKELKIDAQ
jgi:hypothetical protein